MPNGNNINANEKLYDMSNNNNKQISKINNIEYDNYKNDNLLINPNEPINI